MAIESTEAWAAFIEMRAEKGKRAPFTERAKTRILFELRRMAADGQDPEEVLWTSVTNGWSGVFPIRRIGWQPPSPTATATATVPMGHNPADKFHAKMARADAERSLPPAGLRERFGI